MAAPTLETNAAADTLRVMDGTSGDPVECDDVWNWDDGGGSSAGDGDVPKDGGGTAKVSTFMTEIVANAIYTIQKNIQFGNGTDSSHFRSINEHVYFDDGFVFDVRNAATLQLGILTGDWGVNGSYWSMGPSASVVIMDGQTTAVLLFYDSRLFIRTGQMVSLASGTVTINKGVIHLSGNAIKFNSNLAGVGISELYSHGGSYGIRLSKQPSVLTGYHGHAVNYGVLAEANAVVTDARFTNTAVADIATLGGIALQIVDAESAMSVPLILNAADIVLERHTVNVHVNDKDGANLESATVAATSYGNIVSNDAGSTFYRCVEDHTSGTFATDVTAKKWRLATGGEEVLAGVTGAAGAGAWVTGIAYTKAAEEFSVSTDANGDIAEQTLTRKKWFGTSKALQSYAPYTFAISKANYETLTLENIEVDAAIGWVQEMGETSILGVGDFNGGFA